MKRSGISRPAAAGMREPIVKRASWIGVLVLALIARVAPGTEYKLMPKDGAPNDQFGGSIAMEGDFVAVGVPYDDPKGQDSGSVVCYQPSAGYHLFTIVPSDIATNDHFGSAVAVSGYRIVVELRMMTIEARIPDLFMYSIETESHYSN